MWTQGVNSANGVSGIPQAYCTMSKYCVGNIGIDVC